MTDKLIPAAEWRRAYWPVHDRTIRRAEMRDDDPFPIVRINRRKYVRPAEAAAWLARQDGATPDERAETEALVDRAARTGESLDDLAAERTGGAA
jgi:hypothetical protein